MMDVTLRVCVVENAAKRWVKAKAILSSDRLVVTDRRNRELLSVDASQEDAGDRAWRYGDYLVTDTGGCGCGGTRIETKKG